MGHSIYIYSINFIEIIFISKNFLYKVKEQHKKGQMAPKRNLSNRLKGGRIYLR